MINTNTARQIILEVRAVFPQGLRQALRTDLTGCMEKADRRLEFSQFLKKHATEEESQTLLTKLEGFTSGFQPYFYAKKLHAQELDKIVNKALKELNVEIINLAGVRIRTKNKLDILDGLLSSKQAGLKLPQNIVIKELPADCKGKFISSTPKSIYLDSRLDDVFRTTIHEIGHKGDELWQQTIYIPFCSLVSLLASKAVTFSNKKVITKELGKDALKNRQEYLAYTIEKLLAENKTWSNLNPKIKKIYNLFMGPNLSID